MSSRVTPPSLSTATRSTRRLPAGVSSTASRSRPRSDSGSRSASAIRELSGLTWLTSRPPVLLSLTTIAGGAGPDSPASPGPVGAAAIGSRACPAPRSRAAGCCVSAGRRGARPGWPAATWTPPRRAPAAEPSPDPDQAIVAAARAELSGLITRLGDRDGHRCPGRGPPRPAGGAPGRAARDDRREPRRSAPPRSSARERRAADRFAGGPSAVRERRPGAGPGLDRGRDPDAARAAGGLVSDASRAAGAPAHAGGRARGGLRLRRARRARSRPRRVPAAARPGDGVRRPPRPAQPAAAHGHGGRWRPGRGRAGVRRAARASPRRRRSRPRRCGWSAPASSTYAALVAATDGRRRVRGRSDTLSAGALAELTFGGPPLPLPGCPRASRAAEVRTCESP